jgi:NAD(P)-dependent dehydrogenase (short-subunit alcohol dehydrogenase family)
MRTIAELMDLSGRVSLITGGTGVLGKLYAATLAEMGCDLVLLDRPESDFDAAIRAVSPINNINIHCVVCDLENEGQRKDIIDEIAREIGRLDILINNAAFVGESNLEGWVTPFDSQSLTTWRRAFEVNLTAVFDLCQKCSPMMATSQNASIINISSIYGISAPDYNLYEGTRMGNPAAYAASKGGLVQLTRWLATTLAPKIRVNTISPGGVFRNQPESFIKRYETRTPLRRMATEEDFKGIIAFLASDMSSYVTGQNFIIDGGWTTW